MTPEVLVKFKAMQKESWSSFAPLEMFTMMPAASLVKFSRVKPKHSILDVGCGTGVVAITAAKLGCQVTAMDLCPTLLERAKENAALASVDVDFKEGDVEALPYPDHSFDAVLSQFGHMFAPRPQIAIKEMLRVLKPGGTLAFSSWPPHLYMGRFFALAAKYSPPPEGVSPPTRWGDPNFVREQLGEAVDSIFFEQDVMRYVALSLGHYRQSVEATVGPVRMFTLMNDVDPSRLKQFRMELEALASEYYEDNHIHQHFMMTRATKK